MAAIKTYKSYMFVDKDPVIDELRTLVKDSGLSYDEVSDECGVASSTLYSWFHKDTRRPQNATIEAVGRGLGFKRKWVRTGERQPLAKPKRAPKKKRNANTASDAVH